MVLTESLITILIICGTVFLIALIIIIVANYWMFKFYEHRIKTDKEKMKKEACLYNDLGKKIDNLIYIQNKTVEGLKGWKK